MQIKKPKKLEIGVILPFAPFNDKLIRPIPPLNFDLTMNGQKYDFSEHLDKFVSDKNARSFCKYSNDQAKIRNKILYASNQGIPSVQLTEGNLKRKEEIIISFITVYLLIAQYDERQLFVQQALDVFVKILNLSEKLCT